MEQCVFVKCKDWLIEGSSEKVNRIISQNKNAGTPKIGYWFSFSVVFKNILFISFVVN
jgi:hypothetical protein